MLDVKNILGKRLQILRGEKTLYEIEQATGVSRGNLTRYEQGLHLPTKPVLLKLAKIYNVSYAELRLLYYEDYYSRDSQERELVLQWAKNRPM